MLVHRAVDFNYCFMELCGQSKGSEKLKITGLELQICGQIRKAGARPETYKRLKKPYIKKHGSWAGKEFRMYTYKEYHRIHP